MSGHAAALWAGLHIILLLVLSLLVTRQRQKHHVATGDGDIEELQRAVRAQGNATEYIPAGLAGLAVLAIAGAQPLVVHIAGAVMFIGRMIHAVSLSMSLDATLPRSIGASITWVAYIIIGVALLIFSIGRAGRACGAPGLGAISRPWTKTC
jgi:uncharacterized membrane protein YecN with MAPEG domain